MSETANQTPPRLRFSVAPEPSRLLRARDRIREYLTLHCADQDAVDDVVLAVEEACTNAIRHSGSSEAVSISLAFSGNDLRIAVKDRGQGFDVAAFDREAPPDPLLDHGRGLFLISQLTDEMELCALDGLEVRLLKKAVPYCEAPPLDSGLGDISGRSQVTRRDARSRALLEEIDEAFIALDWEYRAVYANAAALRFSGMPRETLLGVRLWDLLPSLLGTPQEGPFGTPWSWAGRPTVEYHTPQGSWLEARVYPTAAGVSIYFREIDERKRAEAERDRLLETTSLLLEAATTATSWADLDQMLESFGDLLVRSTDHSRVLLELWDEERQEVEIAVSRGSAPAPRQRFAFDDVSDGAKAVITTRKTSVIDYAETGLPAPQKHYVDEHAFLLTLVVPIVSRERLIGLVTLDEPGGRRPFSPPEIQLVEAIAGQIGGAIENAQLFAAEVVSRRLADQELRTTSLLLDGATILADSTDLEAGLRRALDTMRETIEGVRAVVYGYDESRSELHVLASAGGPAPPVGTRFPCPG